MKMNYGLRPVSKDEMRAIIPTKYWVHFQKLDNADQCFLIANPDQCEGIIARGFKRARLADTAKTKRDAGMTWAQVIAELRTEHGQSPCESTLRRMVAEL